VTQRLDPDGGRWSTKTEGLSGQTLTKIGAAFGLENYSSVSSVVSRMKQRIANDRRLKRKVKEIEQALK
jgi:chromosomal replication initiation ATPase DnaA